MKSLLKKVECIKRFNYSVLSISHTDYTGSYAGTEKVILKECLNFNKKHIHYIHIFPITNFYHYSLMAGGEQIVGVNFDGKKLGFYPMCVVIDTFIKLEKRWLNFFQICRIHHLMGFSIRNIHHLLSNVSFSRYYFFIHDFYSICPQFNLMYNNTFFCNHFCMDDMKKTECYYSIKQQKHDNQFKGLFENYNFSFIAPSQVAKDIWSQVFSLYSGQTIVHPHLIIRKTDDNLIKKTIDEPIRIAYLGYESTFKGYEVWKKIVQKNLDLGYELFHIGYCTSHLPSVQQIPIINYDDGNNDVSKIISEKNIQICLLFSLCPETFSFTFFESLIGGAFILTSNVSGNIAYSVEKYACGRVFSDEKDIIGFLSDKGAVIQALKNYEMTKKIYDCIDNESLIQQDISYIESLNKKTSLIYSSCSSAHCEGFTYHCCFDRFVERYLIFIIRKYDGALIFLMNFFISYSHSKNATNFSVNSAKSGNKFFIYDSILYFLLLPIFLIAKIYGFLFKY